MTAASANAHASDASGTSVPARSRPGGTVFADERRQVEPSADVVESVVQQIEQLQDALGHRTTVGQAQGILMERWDIDADAAIEYLKRVSMDSNRKLVEIADEIARTRVLPRHRLTGRAARGTVPRPPRA